MDDRDDIYHRVQEALKAPIPPPEFIFPRESARDGIGELSEKSLHRLLKSVYAPDPAHREVKLGRYIADVCDGKRIVEIQTSGLARLLPKLREFLAYTDLPVTVVYPMARRRRLIWVDPDTGEMTKPRLGCRKEHLTDAFHALRPLGTLLEDPRIRTDLFLFDFDEYRLLCGYSRDRKKGSIRGERIPTALVEFRRLSSPADYLSLFPEETILPDPFSAAALQKTVGLRSRPAYSAIHLLESFGLLAKDEKRGRTQFYRRI